jgi:hypothetical protein
MYIPRFLGDPVLCVPGMTALRLTCREIEMKTFDFFTRVAFGTIDVTQTYEGLERLVYIAKSRCAPRVKQLLFSSLDRVRDSQDSLLV